MNKKELKNLAKKIAECERIIQSSNDKEEIARAKNQELYYSSKLGSLEDMLVVDEMVQKFLDN